MVTFDMNHLMCFTAKLFLYCVDQAADLRMFVKLM